ncbi:rhodanese-like domain-containing protein [Actinopolymorpha sp. NPDC004070]|uniref:rhodanese-like domain-containing protein n=1 Tax=Actinopolymorpha sp. NPDC004070 TaxID=3154548 RepID=UPI0033B7B08E
MAHEVEMSEFVRAQQAGHLTVDVREPEEYTTGHVPGARLIPLGTLPQHTASLPKDQPIYVICASGHRSLAGADVLTRAGLEAHSVAGGTLGWMRAGNPVVTGDSPT